MPGASYSASSLLSYFRASWYHNGSIDWVPAHHMGHVDGVSGPCLYPNSVLTAIEI